MTKIKGLHLGSGSEREHGMKKQTPTGRKKYFKEKSGRNLLQRRKHDWVSESRVSPEDPGKE